MKKALAKATIASALALSFALLGCESDSTVATTEDSNDDQALSLSVMTARGDTLTAPVENEIVDEPPPPRVAVAPRPSAPPRSIPQTQGSASLPAITPSPRQAPSVAPERRPSIVAAAPRAVEERKESRTESPREKPEASERTGIISSGSALALVTSERVCDAVKEGSTFSATVADPVRGSNGVVIPSGAHATAEVTSSKSWGAGISVRLRSVRFNGKSYPVASRVGYVLPERAGCIPARARIEVETKDPLRVGAST